MNKVELMGRLTKDVEVLTYNAGNISMEELRAVNLKCKELGWIE